jgi:molecular chaperone GrpE
MADDSTRSNRTKRTTEPEERIDGEGSAPAATDTVPPPVEEVEELRKERDGLQDRLLRQAAEFDNYRKRIDRERRETAQYAAVDFVQDLLPVIDDFERALQIDAPGAESYRQGLEIIHRALMEMLRKRGVTPIDAVGTDFDPQIHQAVAYEEAADRRDGEVMEQFTRGYRLGDKLVRPAMVKVAKA